MSSWPCSFRLLFLTKISWYLEPDNQEKSACGKSRFDVVVDLLTGSLLEFEKGFVPLEDETIF